MDFLHWTQHAHPRTSPANWPSGKVASHVSVERAIRGVGNSHGVHHTVFGLPTTVAVRARIDQLLKLTESDVWSVRLPYVLETAPATADLPLWSIALAAVDAEAPALCVDAPVSTSVHDDAQLYYSRPGVPTCALGDQCAARLYAGNQGALPIYLSPLAQSAHDRGDPPEHDPHAACLLCIRRDVHGAHLAWNAMCPNPQKQLMRAAVMPPPFLNLVDVPGGYKRGAMAVHASPLFGGSTIVGVSGELAVRYDPLQKAFHFDQAALKITPPAFLGHGTTPRSL